MIKSNLKKKIRILKKLYLVNFEIKGFYISRHFFEIKKKKEKEIKIVQYLRTNRYVIPLPSEIDNLKTKKTKKKILFYTKFEELYTTYENFFKNQRLFFYSTFHSTYNPNKLYYINKFEHTLKFEIFWVLWSVYCLLSEQSFCKNFSKKYFSSKKFKFFSLVYFRDMFKKYWNPNLPLLRKKGENFTSKIEGTALLKLREIIFWELVFEELNLSFKYSDLDLNTFLLANIDPKDSRYFWKTWWLYLLGLSMHDGRISFDTNQKYYKTFSDIPTSDIKNDILLNLKKQVLAQFLFWKEKLIKLASSGSLLYDFNKLPLNNTNFFILKNKIIKNFVFFQPTKYDELNFFIENKFKKQRSLYYVETPIPEYYFGSKNEFLTDNYFWIWTENLINDDRFSALFETDLERFLKKFQISNKNQIYKIFYKNISLYKLEDFNKDFHKMILIKGFKKDDFLVEKTSNLTPQKILYLLRNNIKYHTITNKNYIFPLPDFIKYLFLLLTQENIDSADIDDFFLNSFLHNLSDFKKAREEAREKVKENLGILQTFDYYFKVAAKYKLNDLTIAYKIFMKNLEKFPNKDICLRREEPFGLNPFKFTIKFLTKKDVPFPEAVDYYTFYRAKQKEELLTFNNSLMLKEVKYFLIKIFNFSSILNINKFSFFFLKKKSLWYKKRIYIFKSKCFFNFKIKKTFTFGSDYCSDKINKSELTSSLDFLKFNPINYKNFTEEELAAIWLKNSTKIRLDFFIKTLDKWKTNFIFNKMHNILSINFFFQQSFTAKNILHFFYYNKNYDLNHNFIVNKKYFTATSKFTVYEFNFMNFLKTYYFSKFFFFNFSFLFKLILRNC